MAVCVGSEDCAASAAWCGCVRCDAVYVRVCGVADGWRVRLCCGKCWTDSEGEVVAGCCDGHTHSAAADVMIVAVPSAWLCRLRVCALGCGGRAVHETPLSCLSQDHGAVPVLAWQLPPPQDPNTGVLIISHGVHHEERCTLGVLNCTQRPVAKRVGETQGCMCRGMFGIPVFTCSGGRLVRALSRGAAVSPHRRPRCRTGRAR